MTITRKQVADLREGDVVELHQSGWREGVTLRGPLHESSPGTLWLADVQIRHHDGDVYTWSMKADSTLTVVSRAPRPLYVNHPRTDAAYGDVARDADSDEPTTFVYDSDDDWCFSTSHATAFGSDMPSRLRLLVNGETGQVVL